MNFSAELLDQIRLQSDIVALVREYVPSLRRAGKHWKACCPFHQEKTASFIVSGEKGIFHCFGCSAGGDIFKFAMLTERLSFPEAVRQLAERCHIPLREEGHSPSREVQDRRQLYDIMEFAANFFESRLLASDPQAKEARDYLERRLPKKSLWREFKIGFSPSDGKSLLQALLQKGFPISQIQKAGLVRLMEDGRSLRDSFRGRLMFPIFNPKGLTIGFGGRILEVHKPEAAPKYINSSETPLYAKGQNLYGLPQACESIREKQCVILVEGYLDVLALHQAGIHHVVAPLGTALTPEQIRLLKRYTDRFVFVFDGDEAGLRAAMRGAKAVLEAEGHVRLALIPEGMDPDDYLKRESVETFLQLIESSKDIVEFELERIFQEGRLSQTEDRLAAAQRVLPLIQATVNEIERSEWVKLVARRLSLESEALEKELRRKSMRGKTHPQASAEDSLRGVQVRSDEEELLQCLLHHPDLADDFNSLGQLFTDARCRQVLEIWNESRGKSSEDLFRKILSKLDENTSRWFSCLVLEERHPLTRSDPRAFFENLLDSLQRRTQENRRKELASSVSAMVEGRIPYDAEKVQEFNVLTRQLKGSKNP